MVLIIDLKLKLSSANKENIKGHFTVIVLYTFITIILTFPLILHMGTELSDLGDPLLNTWVLAWDVHSLTTDPFNFFNTNMFYPFTKNTLAFSEHLFGDMILAFPIILITRNPILAHNVILILSFILSGYGMFCLINYYIRDKYSSFIGGIIFAFCTIRFAHIGHLQFLTVQWLPFVLLYLDKFLRRGDYKNLILLYVFFVLQILSSWYLAFFTTISLGAYASSLFMIDKDIRIYIFQPSYQRKWILFTFFVAIAIAPFAIPYMEVAQEYGFIRNLDEISQYSADVGDYFLTPYSNFIYGKFSDAFQTNRAWNEHSLFPGISAIILAFYGILCVKRLRINNLDKLGLIYAGNKEQNVYLLILLLSVILSLGYPLHFFGHVINIDLPYKFLYEYVPGFKSMRVPSRFGIIVMMSLSILAGYGLNKLLKNRNRKFIISFFILFLILAENLYIPIPSTAMPVQQEIPDVYKWLANETDNSAIIEMPTGYFTQDGNNFWYDARYLYYSTYHWKYLVNGYSGFLPDTYFDVLRDLQTFPSNESFNILQATGVKYIIIHKDKMDPIKSSQIEREISNYSKNIDLIKVFNYDYVYKINEIGAIKSYFITPLSGFQDLENWNGVETYWMKSDAVFQVYSNKNNTANLGLEATSFYRPRTLEIYSDNVIAASMRIPSDGFAHVNAKIRIANGENSISLHVPEGCEQPYNIPELSNQDKRCLSLAIQNVSII